MDSSKAPQGTYTKVPNVLLDTCDIPDEAMMLFNRLLRKVGHTGGIFYGSIRKLAIAVGIKRDKAHRNLKALEVAGLATVDGDAIQLNIDGLWELNTAYTNGIEIPRWTNLHAVLETVRNIRQQLDSEASEISDDLSEKSDKSVANIGQGVRKTGQIVRRSELEVSCKKEKNSNTSNKEKESTPPSFLSSDQQTWYEDVFLKSRIGRVPPNIDEVFRDRLTKLMQYISTAEELDDLYAHAKSEIDNSGKKDKTVHLGNLINSRVLSGWLQSRERQNSPPGEALREQEPPGGAMLIFGYPPEHWTEEEIERVPNATMRRSIPKMLAERACTA